MTEYLVSSSSQLDDSINLTRLIRTLRKRWLPLFAISTTFFTGVAVYTFTREPLYESATSIVIDNTTISVSELPTPDMDSAFGRDTKLMTEIAILKSRTLIASAVDRLNNPYGNLSRENFLERVFKNLTIVQERNTRVLRLKYRDSDQQRAQDVLKSLVMTYADYSIKDRRSRSSNAIKFIEAKLPQVKKQLDKSALVVTQFRKKYSIVDPDSYAASVYAMRQALETQAQDMQIKMAQTRRQFQELQNQVGKPADVALSNAILTQDATYQSLVKQFQDTETQYFLERTRFQEKHPAVQALKDRREQLYNLMQSQAQAVLGTKASTVGVTTESSSTGASSIKQNLASQLFETQTALAVQAAQVGSIRQAQKRVEVVFGEIPRLQQTFTELQRQLTLDSSIYTKLSEKLEELRINEAQETASWRVLDDPSLPSQPVSPRVLFNLLIGAVTGAVMGIVLAILLERSDERITEIEEVKELTDIPLLGAIPLTELLSLNPVSGSASQGKVSLPPSYIHSAFTESLRSLALNLRYLGSDQSVKTIAFTSAIPSEGKSTLIYNLGIVLAELGHKVLVVDADMRKPTIHKQSQKRNTYGLSTAIATNRPWQHIVQPLAPKSRMHILTSGPLPPNPIALLESAKMGKLLQVWRQTYDYVLIDTPPIVGITDAQSLASKVDSMVLVAAIGRSTRSSIARAIEILVNSRCNMAGILINMITKNHSGYHYNYYSSYYQTALPSSSDAELEKEELVARV